jgi:hypothetical protein
MTIGEMKLLLDNAYRMGATNETRITVTIMSETVQGRRRAAAWARTKGGCYYEASKDRPEEVIIAVDIGKGKGVDGEGCEYPLGKN